MRENQSNHKISVKNGIQSQELQENRDFFHIPVLSRELIEGLNIRPGGHYLDATVGGGGHSALILATFPDVRVTAIDRDEQALTAAKVRLAEYGDERIDFWQGNFADYNSDQVKFDGIIADLGVNSAQLDIPERGFSFQHTAALDMRMDRQQSLTAADIVNHWDEVELADIFTAMGRRGYLDGLLNGLLSSVLFKQRLN